MGSSPFLVPLFQGSFWFFFMAHLAPHHLRALPPDVWRAAQAAPPARVVASGHPELSRLLPGRGWPCHCLIELLAGRPGHGEATVLQPALQRLAGTAPILLVNPPHPPQWQGWALNWPPEARLWWVRPASVGDALWAMLQALRSGACSAVLGWLPQVSPLALRRLHLAAQATTGLCVLVRPWAMATFASPAPLRLGLQPTPQGVELHFIKMRGHLPAQPLQLALHAPGSLQVAATKRLAASLGVALEAQASWLSG